MSATRNGFATTFGTYRGPWGNGAPPHADQPIVPEGEGWWLHSVSPTIDGLLVWTWSRVVPVEVPEEAPPVKAPRKAGVL